MIHEPILVVGATGAVGSELVSQLRHKGERVRGATRKPADASRRFGSAVECVEFDLERPETYATALTGVKRVFLIAPPGDDHSDRLAIPLIDEMKRQGVRHVVDLSAYGAETRDDFALRKIEKYLEASGMAFTHLRPNWFMQVFASGPLLVGIRSNAAIAIPTADAKISYIDVRDIAAVAAVALTANGHTDKAYTLTGPQSLNHNEIAHRISNAVGKAIRYVPISEEDARRGILSAGLSSERTERLLGFYRLVSAGVCAPVSLDVERVLGRPPIAFEQFAADYTPYWGKTE
jgi:uncharacterized protein YbjT (DUF2867 family)